jgi:hypothetical protein
VITKVDLKAVKPAAAGREGLDLDAALAQRLHITVGQGVTANPVVQQVNRHAFGGFVQQQISQTLTEAVVVDDEELDQDGFLCLADGVENRIERGSTVDQQSHFVVARHGIRPNFGMARNEAYAVEARAVSASSTHGRQLSSEIALRISSLAWRRALM